MPSYTLPAHNVSSGPVKVNFNDIYDYQINNIITLVHKILDYNYETRLSAEECKNELIMLEYQIDKETEI